jgi:hypothetical protein
MLSLSDLFAGHNIIAADTYTVKPSEVNNIQHLNRPSIVIKMSANMWIRVTELKRGYYLTFEHVRLQGEFHKDVLIGQFNTLQKVREVLIKISGDKQYGIKLSLRYINPVVSTLVIDPLGNVIRGVNAIKKSEMSGLSDQGYTFKSITNSDTALNSMKKTKTKYVR